MDEIDENTVLARYFPRDRLFGQTGLLETGLLYLPRLGNQHDILEGVPTMATIEAVAQDEAQVGNPDFVARFLSGFSTLFSKHVTYVSCWTKNTTPSQESANVYGNAIAMVFTNVGRLRAIMPEESELGDVQYVCEESNQSSLSFDVIPFAKRIQFSWEKEVRIVDFSAHKGGILDAVIKNAPSNMSYFFEASRLFAKIVVLPSASDQDRITIESYSRSHGIKFESLVDWPI